MTKEELIKKMGNEDRAKWVMDELLRSVKPAFIEVMLRSKAKAQDAMIRERKESGYYLTYNDLNAPEDFNYWTYMSAVEDGEDEDGSKKAVLDRYDLIDQRMIEAASDKQTSNFYNNMLATFLSH